MFCYGISAAKWSRVLIKGGAVFTPLPLLTLGCSSLEGTIEGGARPYNSEAATPAPTQTILMTPDYLLPASLKDEPRAKKGTIYHFGSRQQRNANPTILLLPGFGLSGNLFGATPDGRTGWGDRLVQAGFNTYAYSGPELLVHHGSEYAQVNTRERWTRERVWVRWGFGAADGQSYPDAQYPVQAVPQLVASFPEYRIFDADARAMIAAGPASLTTQATKANLTPFLERNCPCVLVAHSAAGITALGLLRDRKFDIRAVILLEPVWPRLSKDEAALLFDNIPVLGVYGDYIEARDQTERKAAVENLVRDLVDLGSNATLLDLPKEGIRGNSHLFMQDRNSDALIAKVETWLKDNLRHKGNGNE